MEDEGSVSKAGCDRGCYDRLGRKWCVDPRQRCWPSGVVREYTILDTVPWSDDVVDARWTCARRLQVNRSSSPFGRLFRGLPHFTNERGERVSAQAELTTRRRDVHLTCVQYPRRADHPGPWRRPHPSQRHRTAALETIEAANPPAGWMRALANHTRLDRKIPAPQRAFTRSWLRVATEVILQAVGKNPRATGISNEDSKYSPTAASATLKSLSRCIQLSDARERP
jgi:hypothetical protein